MKTVDQEESLMKQVLFVLSCAAFLLAVPSAHAYAIYNHMDRPLCVQSRVWHDIDKCHVWVDPHGQHNGAHGSGWDNVWFCWCDQDGDSCHVTTVAADIPKGGWASAWSGTVKVFRHDGSEVGGYPFEKQGWCGGK